MKKIYLVQMMERNTFKYYAHKGVKVRNMDVHSPVMTLWCDDKKRAIEDCRKRNQHDRNYAWFVHPLDDYRK